MTPSFTRPDHAIRPAAGEHAPYYATYVNHVADGDILATLAEQGEATQALLRDFGEERGDHRYAPGKWSIREVVGHMIDTERVFAYRAMRFARGDETPLPSFDENLFVANAAFGARSLASLADEFAVVRHATLTFLHTISAAEWERAGVASGQRMTVRASAWVIAGHELHHVELLRTRYQ